MLIRTVSGAGLAVLTVAALLAPKAHAATGSATVFETGVGKLSDLNWNGGNECQVVQLAPPPPDSVEPTREIQVNSEIYLGGFFSNNCTRTTTGGLLINGADFYVSAGVMALAYPSPSIESISFHPR
jgi:hypothetical protein